MPVPRTPSMQAVAQANRAVPALQAGHFSKFANTNYREDVSVTMPVRGPEPTLARSEVWQTLVCCRLRCRVSTGRACQICIS